MWGDTLNCDPGTRLLDFDLFDATHELVANCDYHSVNAALEQQGSSHDFVCCTYDTPAFPLSPPLAVASENSEDESDEDDTQEGAEPQSKKTKS